MSPHNSPRRPPDALTDFLSISSDVLDALGSVPYFGGIAGALDKILQVREEVDDNRDRCEELLEIVQKHASTLLHSLDVIRKSVESENMDSMKGALEEFRIILESIAKTLEENISKRKRKRMKQWLNRHKVRVELERCERRLTAFHERFTMGTLAKVARDSSDIADAVLRRQAVNLLSYADKASWNADLCCIPDTRNDHLDKIHDWFDPPFGTPPFLARMLWLQGPAGSGKSAIAHSVAQQASQHGFLASSFFLTPGTVAGQSMGSQIGSIQAASSRNLVSTLLHDLASQFPLFSDAIGKQLLRHRFIAADPIRQFTELLLPNAHLLCRSKPLLWIIDGFDELRRFDDPHGDGFTTKDLMKLFRHEFPKLPSHFMVFITSRPFPDPLFSGMPAHIHLIHIDLQSDSNLKDVQLIARHKMRHVADEQELLDWPHEDALARFILRAGGLPLWVKLVTNFLQNAVDPRRDLDRILSADSGVPSARNVGLTKQMEATYDQVLRACGDWTEPSANALLGTILGLLFAAQRPLPLKTLQRICKEDHDGLADGLERVIRRLRPLLLTSDTVPSKPLEFIHLSFRDFALGPSQTIVTLSLTEAHTSLAFYCLNLLMSNLEDCSPGTGWLSKPGRDIPRLLPETVPDALLYSSAYWIAHLSHLASISGELHTKVQIFLSQRFILWIEFQTSVGQFKPLKRMVVSLTGTQLLASPVGQNHSIEWKEIASQLYLLHIRLNRVDRVEEALEAAQDAVTVYRQLLPSQSNIRPALAMSLHELGSTFAGLGNNEEAVEAFQEAVDIRRVLASECYRCFAPGLARSLTLMAARLYDLARWDEAFNINTEAVDIWRRLSSECPQKFKAGLASSLVELSDISMALGDRHQSLKLAHEANHILRELASRAVGQFQGLLARSLTGTSIALWNLGRREEALVTMKEAVDIRKRLALKWPLTQNHGLAVCLCIVKWQNAALGQKHNAVESGEQSLAIFRQLAAARPKRFLPGLAESLHIFSIHVATSSDRREEALDAIQQAVDIRRALAAERPASFTHLLASSLQCLSDRQRGFNKPKEALLTIQHAVNIYRQLVQKNSQNYTAFLASSQHTLSRCLAALNRNEEALAAIKETVDIRRSLLSQQPSAPKAPLATSLYDFSLRLVALDRRQEALQAMMEAADIRRGLTAASSDIYTPLFSWTLHTLSVQLFSLHRTHEALDAITEAVAKRRKLACNRPRAFRPLLACSLQRLSVYLSVLRRREEALHAIQEAVEIRRSVVSACPGVRVFKARLAFSLHELHLRFFALCLREKSLVAIQEAVEIRRALSSEVPRQFKSVLACSLLALSTVLADLHFHKEALDKINEAVNFRRELVAEKPQIFTPRLAESLQVLSRQLSRLGRSQEALDAAIQGEEFPISADSSHCLFDLGRKQEALAAIGEAVRLRRNYAERPEGKFPLAVAVHVLSWRLGALGDYPAALTSIRESVSIFRVLLALPEARYKYCEACLFWALHDQARYILNSAIPDRQQSLELLDEAIRLRKELYSDYLPIDHRQPTLEQLINALNEIQQMLAVDDGDSRRNVED